MSKLEKKQLFDGGDSEEEDDCKIKINKNYAQRYDEWREAEIKRKLEDQYGNLDEQLSSSSSDDDDDPQELDKAVSKDFFEVISNLRKKDPKIYNPEVRFFNPDEQPSTSQEKKKKEKPIYLRDYERKLIVERGGVLSDDESGDEGPTRPASPSLAQKERSLKESLQKIVHSDSDDDGLLTKKVKTAAEKKKEEDDYLEWLRGRKEELNDKSLQESLSHLKEEWNNPNLDDGEKFLRDYVLNKRYLDGEDEDVDTGNLTDEDLEEKYMDDFERKFNFRFEEPDSDFLKRYPRTIDSSVRKKDDRRKLHREEVKKRKEEEKLRQREELKVLKSLKRKEILKKIEKIKEITGNAELGISDKDLEGDYDPEEYDRRMNELFNDDFYQEGDEEMNLEDLPLPPLEDELLDDYENWDEYEGEKEDGGEGLHCEDPDFNMDCDFDPEAARAAKELQPKSSRERRKLKRQSRFGTLVRKKKPEFDPNEKSFQQYVDEYYGIDYEDIVGGQPCRFKYRKVMPNSFGLTIEEILAADDKELNAWISIKKATALKPDHVELNEKRMYELKAQNEELKRKILPSLYKHEMEGKNDIGEKAHSKKNKKKFFDEQDDSTNKEDFVDNETDVRAVVTKKKKKTVIEDGVTEEEGDLKKKKKKKTVIADGVTEEEVDLKKKKKKKTVVEDSITEEETDVKKKKKKKTVVGDGVTEEKETDLKKEKKIVVEDGVSEEGTDVRVKKKKKKHCEIADEETVHESHADVGDETVQIDGHESDNVQSQKLSKKERKKQERLSKGSPPNNVEITSGNSDKSKKKGKKRSADELNESTDEVVQPSPKKKGKNMNESTTDVKPFESNNQGSNKKQRGHKNSPEMSNKISDEVLDKTPKKKFSGGGNHPKSFNKNGSQKNVINKDDKNRVLQNPISMERKRRRRSGKDRKKLLTLQKNANKAPRDVKAENKERAIRRQNYKAAPVLGDMTDSRLKAYGLNPKKFKNKLVYG